MGEKQISRRRVVIVDNHPLLRHGLTELINTQPDLEVCAETSTPRAALDAIKVTAADLVITGLSVRDGIGAGLALVADIHSQHADLPVLVLSMHDESKWAERAMQAGASGYLNKQEIGDSLLDTIRTVLDRKGVGSDPA